MLANANTSPRHFASEHANARRGLRLAVPTWGRSVCYAGIACMLAGSLVPSALADGNPSIGWEPEVPSIDPNEPSGGEEPGGNETPDTPEPPVVDPEPEVPVEPDPPISDPEPEIPDSGTTAPDPDYLYPNGSGSVGGEGAFYDPEYPADSVPPAEEQPADPAVSAAVTVPVFGSYDAGTGVLSGSAQPGVTVRVVDGAGNVVGDVVVDENGVFSIALPAGTDLSGLSIYVVDGEGNQVGDVLSGATVVQEIARQEFEAVRTATGTSTVDLAERLSDAVGRVKTAEFIDEPEREGMPVLPYAIGAASAVVAVGAVGAGVALYRRHTPKDGRSSRGRLTPNLSAAGLQTTPAPVVAPDVKTGDAAAQTPGAANANDTFARMDAVLPNHPNGHADVDELDELEMLAMSLHGNPTSRTAKPRLAVDVQTPSDGDDDPNPPDGPGGGAPIDPGSTAAFLSAMGAVRPTPSASGAVGLQQRGVSDGSDGNTSLPTIFMSKAAFEADPETTLISSPFDERPLDDESFARLAHILATGTGKVHRVTRSYSDLDLAGLDLLDEGQHTSTSAVVADPLAARDDWQEVALRELAAPAVEPVREYPQLSTDDYVALVSTQRRQSVDDGASRSQIAYVAPVVGPSSLSAEEAARHQAMLQESKTAAVVALRSRDAAFKNRTRSEDPVRPASFYQARSPMADVPTIVRGDSGVPGPAQRSSNLSDRMRLEKQSLSVPDPACFAPVPVAPAAVPIRDRGVAAAVAAAQSVYAAYGSFTVAGVPVRSEVGAQRVQGGTEVSSAVAAAYAAAVYGSISPAVSQASSYMAQEPRAEYGTDPFVYGATSINEPVGRPLPAIGTEGDFSDPYDDYGVSSGISAAYINYMVQDEFEHRHDTPAQRNAALGRLHIVNGAAHAPVPLAARYRHPA